MFTFYKLSKDICEISTCLCLDYESHNLSNEFFIKQQVEYFVVQEFRKVFRDC